MMLTQTCTDDFEEKLSFWLETNNQLKLYYWLITNWAFCFRTGVKSGTTQTDPRLFMGKQTLNTKNVLNENDDLA